MYAISLGDRRELVFKILGSADPLQFLEGRLPYCIVDSRTGFRLHFQLSTAMAIYNTFGQIVWCSMHVFKVTSSKAVEFFTFLNFRGEEAFNMFSQN